MHEGIATPEALSPYINVLHDDFETRPLAEQVIDQLLAETPERYTTFAKLRATEYRLPFAPGHTELPAQHHAIGNFMSLWIEYEQYVGTLAESKGLTGYSVTPSKLLSLLEGSPPQLLANAERLRQFRNELVHGSEIPDSEAINRATGTLQSLLKELDKIHAKAV